MVKLLIADDHSYLVQGVIMSLTDSDIEVLDHILDASLIVDAYQRLKPDVILCDIMFSQALNGLDVLKLLLNIDPKVKVILFSQYDQDNIIHNAYKFGAKAFIPKSIASSELIEAIHRVNKGELYFTSDIAVRMAKINVGKKADDRPVEEILNPIEIQVMTLLSDGATERATADRMQKSTKWVANIKADIKVKLGIETMAQMTKKALQFGLIKFDDDNSTE